MKNTTCVRYELPFGSLYLPYGGSELTVRDNDGNSLDVRGLSQEAIQNAILDNISSRRWTDDSERKAQHLAFALKVRESADRLIGALKPEAPAAPEAQAAGGQDA